MTFWRGVLALILWLVEREFENGVNWRVFCLSPFWGHSGAGAKKKGGGGIEPVMHIAQGKGGRKDIWI